MEKTMERTIGKMVADDYRTAQVFKNHKIDFCCKGNRGIQEVAKEKNLNVDELIRELDEVQRPHDSDNT
ncbi:hypothetical protein LCGC14_1976510, partial [marine sediment metagenome]